MSDSLPDLCERLRLEAREERVCDACGHEREYRRVWRWINDTWVEGRILGPGYVRGAMQLVCFGCHPEFVVNPYEAGQRPVRIGG